MTQTPEQAQAQFAQLTTAADKLRHSPLKVEIINLLGSADQNADDTVYAERTVGKDEYWSIALSSIGILMEDASPAARRWFSARGYRW